MVLHMFDLPGFDRSKIVPMRVRISLYIPQDITSCWRSLQIEVHLYGIMSQRRVIGHNKKSEQGLEPRDVRHLTCNFALLEKERRLGTRRRFVIGVVNQCVVKNSYRAPVRPRTNVSLHISPGCEQSFACIWTVFISDMRCRSTLIRCPSFIVPQVRGLSLIHI